METTSASTQAPRQHHVRKNNPRPDRNANRRYEPPHIAEISARIDGARDHDDWVYVAAKVVEHRFSPALLVYRFVNECPRALDDLRLQLIESYRKFVLEIEIHTGHRRAADLDSIQRNWSVLVQAASNHSAVQFLVISTDILACYKNAELTEDGKPPAQLLERMNRCYNGHEQVGFTQADLAYAGYVADSVWPGLHIHPETMHEIKIRVSRIPQNAGSGTKYHKPAGIEKMTADDILKAQKANAERVAKGKADRQAAAAAKRVRGPKVKQGKKEGEDKKKRK